MFSVPMTKERQQEWTRKIAPKACNLHLNGAVCVCQHTLLACMLQLSLAPNNNADIRKAFQEMLHWRTTHP